MDIRKLLAVMILLGCILAAPIMATIPTSEFEVTTQIGPFTIFKIIGSPFSHIPTADELEESEPVGSYTVTFPGPQTNFEAYLTVLSNVRKGYTISMSAQAMTSVDTPVSYINYTVYAFEKTIETNNATTMDAVLVLDIPNQNQISYVQGQIGLSINEQDYYSATAGEYSGTLTFTFAAK